MGDDTDRQRAGPSGAPRLRVLLFTNSVAIGGMEEHVRLIAEHLPRPQFEVFAVVPTWPPLGSFLEPLGRAADHLELITPDRRQGRRAQLREAWRLFRWTRRNRIDVAHFHSTTFSGQVIATLAVRCAGVRRLFITEHLAPQEPQSRRTRLVRRAMTRMVTGVICVSQKNLEARQQFLGDIGSKAIVVPNGVDVDRFAPIDVATRAQLSAELHLGDAAVVGTAVRLEPEKGVDDLLAAFVDIRAVEPNVVLLIVGDGSLRAAMEAQAEALGISEHVRFTGFRPDPRPYLGLMDVFVLPVPVGSMSIGLLEAMAMCLPAVITFGGAGEAVVDGQTGLWAKPRDPSSIAEEVLSLLKDEGLRERMGRAAREHVEQQFSAERVATTLAELYATGVVEGAQAPR